MTVPGPRPSSRAAAVALRLENLKDDASDARALARERLLWAWVVTLLGPVSYLVEASAPSRQGWPSADPFLLIASIGFAGAVWVWWWLVARRITELTATVLTCEHLVHARRRSVLYGTNDPVADNQRARRVRPGGRERLAPVRDARSTPSAGSRDRLVRRGRRP